MSIPLVPSTTLEKENRWSLDWTKLIPILLIAACLLAYSDSLRGAFIMDDIIHITNENRIRRNLPLNVHFNFAEDRRHLVRLTLIVNYYLGELDTRGYHIFNLAVHILAGLAFYGVVARTLYLPKFAGRFDRSGPWIAMTCALFWMLHPLQTEAVTYVIQRSESMMGLFYLLTLYCVLRTTSQPRSWVWTLLALISCALGMLCKEVMITAPLVVFLFDRTFMSDSGLQTLRRRPWLYAGLFLPYAVVPILFVSARSFGDMHKSNASAGFSAGFSTPLQYATAQTQILFHYLRLTFWPSSLCMDYFDWPLPVSGHLSDYWLSITGVGVFILLAVFGVWKRTWWGFLAAGFILILLPSSSFVPIHDLVVEHRMYLSLACLTVGVVIAGWATLQTAAKRSEAFALWSGVAATLLVTSIVVALGVRTYLRNQDYQSGLTMYQSIVEVRPGNARAQRNLALAISEDQVDLPDRAQRLEAAIEPLGKSVALLPDDLEGCIPLAKMYADLANLKHGPTADFYRRQAEVQYRHVLQLTHDNPMMYYDLALLLVPGNPAEAEKLFLQAIKLNPDLSEAHNYRGLVLLQFARMDEAESEFRAAVACATDGGKEAHQNLAALLENLNRLDEAITQYQTAVKAATPSAQLLNNFGRALFKAGRYDQARQTLLQAQQIGRTSDQEAAIDALSYLGDLEIATGQTDKGLENLRHAVELRPANPNFLRRLAWVQATGPASLRNPEQALAEAQAANRAMGDIVPEFLDTLAAAYAANGRYQEAAATARRALVGAKTYHQADLIDKLPARIAAYDAGKPWLQPSATQP